jgi:glycosyltransferase involved in cell wall biosynthesis
VETANVIKPFFSVIMPTYNRRHMIGKAIDSVIAQTFSDWELVITDDGSTDKTEELVGLYKDPRITYLEQENHGRSAARNLAIEKAKGVYICFLDSDDYYLPDHLESFHRVIERNNNKDALYYCNTYRDEGNGLIKEKFPAFSGNNPVEFVLFNVIGVPRACLPAQILKIYKFNPDISIGEDIELWVRVLEQYPLIATGEYTVVYTHHTERTVHESNKEAFTKSIEIIRRIIKNDSKNRISKTMRKQLLSERYFCLAQHFEHEKQPFRMIGPLIRSLFLTPSYRLKEKIFMLLNNFAPGKGMLKIYNALRK